MAAARGRAERFGVRNVVVATNTGASMRAALSAFGPGYRYFAVGNPASAHARGLVLHEGVNETMRCALEAAGVTVVLQDRSQFQVHGRSFLGVPFSEVVESVRPAGHINAVSVAYNVLQLLSDGPRVCLEIALMAADAGQLPLDEDCIAIACPSSYCDLPDAALVLRPTKTEDVFSGQCRIKDVLLRPTEDDVWFSQGPLP
jgi:hypothetical protein